MTKILIYFFVFLLPYKAMAGGGEDFLHHIIQSDFEGDASERIGHVINEDKHKNPGVGPAFEIFDLDSDPLVVVDDWKFISSHPKGPSALCAIFRFNVVARTKGEGLPSWEGDKTRTIQAVTSSTSEVVRYCAKNVNGVWMLKKPPLPRVAKKVMISFLENEFLIMGSVVKNNLKSSSPRAIRNASVVRDSLKAQLDVLLSLELAKDMQKMSAPMSDK